ncbi:ChaN family lipoprotein [Thauera sp. SDU_THAU2]|uniref:ChaN family lipoprotein n=1 Tax=Thauera sp. SDU_THAU2 TaxID=3136633 RepID=UPI0031203048
MRHSCIALSVLLALACLLPSATTLAADDRTICLEAGRWTVVDSDGPRTGAEPSAVLDAMAGRDVVLLGEQHDDADHHRWQLQTLAALHARRPDMQIGFEMFPRRVQPALDRWVAGELSEQQFLEQVEWTEVWSMPAELYLPLFHFARLNKVPMLALNIDQSLIRKVARTGWSGVPDAERGGVGSAAAPSAAYVDILFDVHLQHARMRAGDDKKASREDEAFRNFIDSQLVWDRAMAEALAAARGAATRIDGPPPLMVGIMGSGHVRFGHGVAHQLKDLGVAEVGLLLPMSAATPCTELVAGLADAVFAIQEIARSPIPPPRLGVSLEEHQKGVRIAQVSEGSLAARTGLRAGDVIVEAAGAPLKRSAVLASLVRAQPPGTWLPIKLIRADETLELIVRFPSGS